MSKEKWIFDNGWIIFYFVWCFDITYELCGYFDPRHRINLNIIFCRLCLILPFKSKYTDECDPPKWGIAIHSNKFWIYRGGKGNMSGGNKWWTFDMPWSLSWVRTSVWRKDGNWEHETKENRKDFYKDYWNDILWSKEYPYTYVLKSGIIQKRTAKVRVEEREWRWHWFKWLSLTKKISRSINIDFNDEVGEETGSWKGGCTGCSYEIFSYETPEQCLRRMERERKF